MRGNRGGCSVETCVPLAVAGAGVWLDVGFLDAGAGSEMPLGLAHGGASKQERVGAYIIITI